MQHRDPSTWSRQGMGCRRAHGVPLRWLSPNVCAIQLSVSSPQGSDWAAERPFGAVADKQHCIWPRTLSPRLAKQRDGLIEACSIGAQLHLLSPRPDRSNVSCLCMSQSAQKCAVIHVQVSIDGHGVARSRHRRASTAIEPSSVNCCGGRRCRVRLRSSKGFGKRRALAGTRVRLSWIRVS